MVPSIEYKNQQFVFDHLRGFIASTGEPVNPCSSLYHELVTHVNCRFDCTLDVNESTMCKEEFTNEHTLLEHKMRYVNEADAEDDRADSDYEQYTTMLFYVGTALLATAIIATLTQLIAAY